MKNKQHTIGMMLLAGSITQAQQEDAPTVSLNDALKNGSIMLDTRFRYETGDQDGREKSDVFSTRLRLGYETGIFFGMKALAEFEGTHALNGEDEYNPFPQAGKTVIADPENAELNRLQLAWSGANSKVALGRQRIILDNSRWIGNIGWRQNEQTFDGISLSNQSMEDITFYYAWIDQVNRIFGQNAPAGAMKRFHSNIHLLNIAYDALKIGKITAYNYYLDLENSAANSSNSWGISLSGKKPLGAESAYTLAYYWEFAMQSDLADNPADYDAAYYHINAMLSRKSLGFGLGYEVLESDNGANVRMPLSTAHKFNGFADLFLTTPADGLEDFYIVGKYAFPKNIMMTASYHDYESNVGNVDYGDEWNMVVNYKSKANWSALAKYADYSPGDPGTKPATERFSVQLDYKF